MTHRYTYCMGLIIGIVGLAGCDPSKDKATPTVGEGNLYEAQLVRDKALHLEPVSSDGKPLDKLEKLSFREGSQLFTNVINSLEAKRPFGSDTAGPPTGPPKPKPGPGPDPVDPTGVVVLKDPFGILSGRQPIPWKLLNPAAEDRTTLPTCKVVCEHDGGCTTTC
jgi:hypothetical protein